MQRVEVQKRRVSKILWKLYYKIYNLTDSEVAYIKNYFFQNEEASSAIIDSVKDIISKYGGEEYANYLTQGNGLAQGERIPNAIYNSGKIPEKINTSYKGYIAYIYKNKKEIISRETFKEQIEKCTQELEKIKLLYDIIY
jgi:hypothetical protein